MNGRRRYTRKRRRSVGAWVYPLCFVFLGVGAFTASNLDDPSVAELEQVRRCAPLEWHAGMDREGWNMLVAQGYRERGDDGMTALYPPGCEGVAQ